MMISLLFLTLVLANLLPHSSLAFTPPHRGNARLFLDSADMQEWDSLLATGIFYGVTTNPSLLKRCNQPCSVDNLHRLAARALSVTNEFFCQTWGETAIEMYERAVALSRLDQDKIIIKVPITKTGVEAAHQLHQSGVKVCLTACYNSKQAFVAAGVGAMYLAPHLERMNAAGRDGYAECTEMVQIMKSLGAKTRLLLASIRNPESMAILAAQGFDSFAMPADVAESLFIEPLTDARAQEFQDAAVWDSTQSSIVEQKEEEKSLNDTKYLWNSMALYNEIGEPYGKNQEPSRFH